MYDARHPRGLQSTEFAIDIKDCVEADARKDNVRGERRQKELEHEFKYCFGSRFRFQNIGFLGMQLTSFGAHLFLILVM